MIAVLSLALVVASLGQTAPEVTRSTGIRFVARVAYPDGRTEDKTVKTLRGDLTALQSFYVSVPASVCEGLSVSDQMPSSAAKGWRVSLGPVKYAPESRTRVRAEVLITAQDAHSASDVKVLALPTQTTQRTGDIVSVTGLRPVNDCNAVAVTLQGRLLPEPEVEVRAETRPTLIEAELWFVHKAPDGKETSQRQVVRIREDGQAQFYFDDLELQTRWMEHDIKLTVEVFGGLLATKPKDGKVEMMLGLTRRYLTKQNLIGKWPKSGQANMPITVTVGEVLSFMLPPLEDDSGVFLGHRFSVRMRIRPLGEGNN